MGFLISGVRVDAYSSSLRLLGLSSKETEVQPSARTAVVSEFVTDEHLMSRLHQGDHEAIAALFRRYSSAIYRVGKKMLRDSGEADDLVQEVFLYVYRRFELFDPSKGPARSWIFQIAYTQALLRRRKLQSIGLYSSVIAGDLRDAESNSNLHAEYDETVEGLFGRSGWRKIVEDLTEDQRETLRLHFFEGYTFAEIAKKLGQSYANIRNHHYRGLQKLRGHLVENAPNRR
jgi:RNA polymerase sigma-70 factor, ECF subfamily